MGVTVGTTTAAAAIMMRFWEACRNAVAESHHGTSESFPAERHAPVAERAIRTLKGIVATLELELRENGVQIGDDPDTLEYLFRYAAHVHNRFSTPVGSTMSPFQKLRGHDHQPHLTYPFGAVVFAKVSKSSREEVDSKYARGVYLGPVLGSTGHLVHIRLDSGETKKVIAPGLKLLYPLRYDGRPSVWYVNIPVKQNSTSDK